VKQEPQLAVEGRVKFWGAESNVVYYYDHGGSYRLDLQSGRSSVAPNLSPVLGTIPNTSQAFVISYGQRRGCNIPGECTVTATDLQVQTATGKAPASTTFGTATNLPAQDAAGLPLSTIQMVSAPRRLLLVYFGPAAGQTNNHNTRHIEVRAY
jgi:hypothetical protein